MHFNLYLYWPGGHFALLLGCCDIFLGSITLTQKSLFIVFQLPSCN